MAAPPCPLLGDGVTDDTLLHIASFITSTKDLLRLQLTNKRFSVKCIAAPSASSGGGPAAAPEMLCIPDEAARGWVAGCSEQERGWVSRRGLESWLGLMHEVEVLRLPLAFGRSHGNITLSENGAVATMSVDDWMTRAAASTAVMRSGRHFAQFTVVSGDDMMFGVVRPGWDVEGGVNALDVDGHCFYGTHNGRRDPGYTDWEGMQGAEQGDRIGMLLDLDQGSMSICKNGERLGVMQAEGLTGPLCWAVSIIQVDKQRPRRVGGGTRVADAGGLGSGSSVAAPKPALPTADGDGRRVRCGRGRATAGRLLTMGRVCGTYWIAGQRM